MQIGTVWKRGPLVGHEGGELARLVELLRGVDLPLPIGLHDVPGQKFRRLGAATAESIGQPENERTALLGRRSCEELAEGRLRKRAFRFGEQLQLPEVFGVIRDAQEIQRQAGFELSSVLLNLLAARKAIGIFGIETRPNDVSIEGHAGVQVKLTEIGVPEWICRNNRGLGLALGLLR